MIRQVQCFGAILFILPFIYLARVVLTEIFEDESVQVDDWLDQNDLGEYKKLFSEYGISTLSGCASPELTERLPELPAVEEKRLRRAALVLQQRLILRQWLASHHLQHAYTKLLNLDVSSIEDVYWLEDSAARHVLEPRDLARWSAARQTLPTRPEPLYVLKEDLWNTVVKTTKHKDAWTWGGMVVVTVSVCGLVTLAAMTQPALAPEAKHSLLQYVTGKYLHPASCRVEWGWLDPQPVGETMCFTVLCYQRNGHPYPISDADNFDVIILNGSRKVSAVVEVGSGQSLLAHTARVQFTVRAAGQYLVHVTIGGVGICGSPFRRWFVGGRVSARRTRVSRAAPALVWCAGRARALHLHPRDEYDNPAPLAHNNTKDFEIKISRLGGEVDAKLSSSAQFEYDSVNERVTLSLMFEHAGVYRATLYYDGGLLLNGELECIVLTASDTATVTRNTGSRRGAWHEARLAAPGRPRRVLCCLTAKHFTVKDYIFKFIPKRITSFRLCPSTKLILKAGNEPSPAGEFTLEDGVQPALQLSSAERDLIAATFAQLLIANCGGEDTFKNKQEFFYSELRKVHVKHPHEKVSLRVDRSDLVRSSLKATRHFAQQDWCKNFDITFQGEQGVDWGGVRREWFSLLCGQLFDAKVGLFAPLHDSPTGLVHPNPDRPTHLKLKHFELAGKLVGKCLYESALGGGYRLLVRARLTRSFLALLIGLRVHYKHFEQDDPELYLSKVKYVMETDLETSEAGPEIYFVDEVYDAVGRLVYTKELVPNGAAIRVDNGNKLQYLDLLAQWRLVGRVRREADAFLRGLALLVPDHLLAIFDENELEVTHTYTSLFTFVPTRSFSFHYLL